MNALHTLLVNAHILVGAIALVLFWIPIVAKKGSALHVRAGKLYTYAMYFVSVSAFLASVMVLADPIGIRRPGLELDPEDAIELAEAFRMFALFLLMLSVLVFTSIRHGLAALRVRHEPDAIRNTLHRGLLLTLGALGVAVGGLGLLKTQWLLVIFGGISISGAVGMFRDTRIESFTRSDRLVAHLGGLIGSGIGAYTAFFAFGGSRVLADLLPGQWQVVSWVIAPVIGTIAIRRLTRRYQKPARLRSGRTA
ncbi:MAG: hypothetical protein AAFX56_13985 [Pseudomonadota bacterium]